MPTQGPGLQSQGPITLPLILMMALILCGCGEEVPETEGTRRVGEACANNKECEAGLACLQTELRCVILCTPDSDECGAGIECRLAGDQGFCPLPPL